MSEPPVTTGGSQVTVALRSPPDTSIDTGGSGGPTGVVDAEIDEEVVPLAFVAETVAEYDFPLVNPLNSTDVVEPLTLRAGASAGDKVTV